MTEHELQVIWDDYFVDRTYADPVDMPWEIQHLKNFIDDINSDENINLTLSDDDYKILLRIAENYRLDQLDMVKDNMKEELIREINDLIGDGDYTRYLDSNDIASILIKIANNYITI